MLLGVGQPLATLTNSLRPPVTKHLLSETSHALLSEQWPSSKKDETSGVISTLSKTPILLFLNLLNSLSLFFVSVLKGEVFNFRG